MSLVLAQWSPWLVNLSVVAFCLVCIVLILVVLIQRPQGGGLSGAFGSGAGSGQTAFGAKTGDALTIATISMFVVYVLVAVTLNYGTRPSDPASVLPAAVTTDTNTETTDGDPAPVETTPPAPIQSGNLPAGASFKKLDGPPPGASNPTIPGQTPATAPNPAPTNTPAAPPATNPDPAKPEGDKPAADPATAPPTTPPSTPPGGL